jgi:hypothetical protein
VIALLNKDGKFGLSFGKIKKKFFKEYSVELFGKDSPGPQKYNAFSSTFKEEKF